MLFDITKRRERAILSGASRGFVKTDMFTAPILTYHYRVSFSAYLIGDEVEDVVFKSGCRMWCTHLAATETIAVASSTSEIASGNSCELAGERAYCMSRGDCRWWTMSNRTRNWSSAWSWVTRQSERPDWSAPGPATSTCHCRSSWPHTCPRSGLSTSIGFTRMWVRARPDYNSFLRSISLILDTIYDRI